MRADASSRAGPGNEIVVDYTHMGRRASGIERVTGMMFSRESLAPLPLRTTATPGRRFAIVFNQMVVNPFRAALRPRDVWVFPGYPPSPAFRFLTCDQVLYVHDLFLMTRWNDLNWPAKIYMALPFWLAVRNFRYFFVNSLTTGQKLAAVARPGARIMAFRPPAHNVLNLMPADAAPPKSPDEPIVIGGLGTVEPRKNFIAAAQIIQALNQQLNKKVELHIVGRPGWGNDYEQLRNMPHVHLHGFVPDDQMPELVARWDALICCSHDEGLGLPLLEAQHGGLPIIAPDQEIFHEVLGTSGVYIRPGQPFEAATTIAEVFKGAHWRQSYAELGRQNITRWNFLADGDRRNAVAFLSDLLTKAAAGRAGDKSRANGAG